MWAIRSFATSSRDTQLPTFGYGSNRTAKSNTIRKIFEDIVFTKNMRFVTHAKQRGWVLMEERDIKLKIGHALRDAEKVRQRRARKTAERKLSLKTTPVDNQLPAVENTLLQIVIDNSNNENSMPSVTYFARSNEEPSLLSEDEHADCDSDNDESTRTTTCVDIHSQPKPQCYCSCNCQGSTPSYNGHAVKHGNMNGLTHNELKKCIPLEYASGPSIPFWANKGDNCASVSTPLNYALDDSEPLPLSHDFAMGNEDLSSLCASLEGNDDDSSTFDVSLSVIYLEFMKGKKLVDEKTVLADAQPADWWLF